MGTEFLRSQNCLQCRFRRETLSRSRNHHPPNPSPSYVTSQCQNSSHVGSESNPPPQNHRSVRLNQQAVAELPKKNISAGHVNILNRGEQSIRSPRRHSRDGRKPNMAKRGEEDVDWGLKPGPEIVQKQVRVRQFRKVNVVYEIYAGTASFFASPPPSSVPLPGFLRKRVEEEGG